MASFSDTSAIPDKPKGR